jgi:hypothetical protein
MHVMMSWIDPHDGSVSGGVKWPGYFEEVMPVVGDTIVEAGVDGPASAGEVVERYIYFVEDNEQVWHLILKHVDLKPGREQALHLMRAVEGVNCFHIDMGTAESYGLTVAGGTPLGDD